MTTSGSKPLAIDLAGYELLVAVTGGIAAYKVCEVVSHLVQRGAGVTVAMTRAARKFVRPMTFQALCGRRVLTSQWDLDDAGHMPHLLPTETANLLLVAPATANIIGKIAAGIADDLVSTLVIGAASPVVLAPAMNDRMWANPIVERNVAALKERGLRIIGPGRGWLACRSVGAGRMAEPCDILETVASLLKADAPLKADTPSPGAPKP